MLVLQLIHDVVFFIYVYWGIDMALFISENNIDK